MADFTTTEDQKIISGVPNPGTVGTVATTVQPTLAIPSNIAASDPRYADLNNQEAQKLSEYNQTYDQFLNENQALTDQQQKLIDEYASQQKTATQAQTDLMLEQINQQKAQQEKDFNKSATGAYTDYQKESNNYGVGAEQRAAGGLQGTGYSESSRTGMFNAYQNRISVAKESYLKAVMNYDNSMKEAMLNNSTKLAEIAYQQLQQSLALSLQSFQYRSQLAKDKLDYTTQMDNTYYGRYQDVLNQINLEKQQAEDAKRYELDRAWEWEKWHQDQMNWQAEYDLASKPSSSSSSGGSYYDTSGGGDGGSGDTGFQSGDSIGVSDSMVDMSVGGGENVGVVTSGDYAGAYVYWDGATSSYKLL